MEVRIGTLAKLIELYAEKGKPLFIHGTMGIGKSQAVRQAHKKIAEKKGLIPTEGLVNVTVSKKGVEEVNVNYEYKDPAKHFFLIDVRISGLDPSDLRGIPFPDGNVVKWLQPNFLPKEGSGIIFFDEMNLAPPSIQAPAYQLVLDRKAGEYELPKGWNIVAAGNLMTDKANVYPLAGPLNNRFSHVTLIPPSSDEWTAWALEAGVSMDIIGFINFKRSLLHKFDGNSKDDAFPTHRTWHLAHEMTQDLSSSDWESKNDSLPFAVQVIASCVGEGAAYEFHGFHKLKSKINFKDLLKNPKKVKEINDIGMKHSMVSGLVDLYKEDRKHIEPILNIIEFLDSEFGIYTLRMMGGVRPKDFTNDVLNSKSWDTLHKEYGKYLM